MIEVDAPKCVDAHSDHDWRLLERASVITEPIADGGVRMYGEPFAFDETWYCTRCRYVERRRVPNT